MLLLATALVVEVSVVVSVVGVTAAAVLACSRWLRLVAGGLVLSCCFLGLPLPRVDSSDGSSVVVRFLSDVSRVAVHSLSDVSSVSSGGSDVDPDDLSIIRSGWCCCRLGRPLFGREAVEGSYLRTG